MQAITSLGFIGAGNMAREIIKGLLKQGLLLPEQIWAACPDQAMLTELQRELGIQVTQDNQRLVQTVDFVVLAVKPQVFPDIVREFSLQQPLACQAILSVMAGVSIRQIEQQFAKGCPIIRSMPNMAACLGASCTGLVASRETPSAIREVATQLMQAVGKVLWFEQEQELDVVTAVSGSGPAYFFLLIEALERAAEAQGLTRDQAQCLARQTALGAAQMVQDSAVDVAALRKQVTSKGGTTEAALNVFEQGGLLALVEQAVQAAKARAEQLAQFESIC